MIGAAASVTMSAAVEPVRSKAVSACTGLDWVSRFALIALGRKVFTWLSIDLNAERAFLAAVMTLFPRATASARICESRGVVAPALPLRAASAKSPAS